jgi:methyl-accepting chemotaxis protein
MIQLKSTKILPMNYGISLELPSGRIVPERRLNLSNARRLHVNFDDAIRAHSQWKQKLSAYVSKPDRSLNASEVSADSKCQLGQWLSGEGKKFASLTEFSQLTSDHSRFHKAAGDVIRKADSGQNVTEEIALGANSEFAVASTAVVKSLMAMKSKAKT